MRACSYVAQVNKSARTRVGLRLGFVTSQDPDDISGWSGINTFMSRALAEAGAEVSPLFGYKRSRPLGAILKKAWAHLVLRRYYEIGRNPAVLRNYARQIESRAARGEVQALFSTGTHLTADCKSRVPMFFWTDATVPALFALYPGYERFWGIGYNEALASERRAVINATGMFFSSHWAAESAVRELGADPTRVHVVPFGANFENAPVSEIVLARAAARSRDTIVLLFAGVDWLRKGGEKAIEIAQCISGLGLAVSLHILGLSEGVRGNATMPIQKNLKVTWHGKISKATKEGRRKIECLFDEAHFLLLPTLADCTPMVFAEANAFAMPVVTHRVGGIPTMIRDEYNGRMFALESSASEQAEWMAAVWREKSRYNAMTISSREAYDANLNWRRSAEKVMKVVSSAITEGQK